jgi:hypothetical protein
MTFADIERLTGPLPVSARQYRPWWANHASHSQAVAWMKAGWQVAEVNMIRERVRLGPSPVKWWTLSDAILAPHAI